MDVERPGYYAVIPADVRYDENIPPNAKLLYGEISALIGAEGFCYATNSYFMKIYGFSDPTISRLISSLEKHGYIKRELERDTSGQVVRRKIYLGVSIPEIQPPINFDTTSPQKKGEGGIKNDGYTNLSNTVKKKVKKEKPEKKNSEPLTDEELREFVVEAITHLADPDWCKDVKNEIFSLVMTMYDPERVVKKARPVRSKNSVNAMFRKLRGYGGHDPNAMILMLCTAIEAGWQGVQPPGRAQMGAPAYAYRIPTPREERDYQCV